MEACPIDPLNFLYSRFGGDGKVTIGITGLWRLSDHSDAAFWSFDVGSSCHSYAKVATCGFVQPLIGNVSWVKTVVRQVSFTLLVGTYYNGGFRSEHTFFVNVQRCRFRRWLDTVVVYLIKRCRRSFRYRTMRSVLRSFWVLWEILLQDWKIK